MFLGIQEIIDTEEEYVNDLHIVSDAFILPMKFNKLVTDQEANVLFGQIEAIRKVNEKLLEDWHTRDSEIDEAKVGNRGKKKKESVKFHFLLLLNNITSFQAIADLFMAMSPYFKIYSAYCSNQPKSMLKLEEYKKNSAFLTTLKVRNLHITSYIQNIL